MNFCPAPTPTTLLIVGLLALLTPSEALCQNWIVTGTVLDSAGGPIQGADLDLVDPNEPGGEVPVTADNTDADGVFSMIITTTIPAQVYVLQINPPAGFVATTVEVDLDGNFDVGIVNVGSGWIINGVVQDILGNPLSPIDIDIRGNNTDWLDLTGDFTEPDGTFSMTIPALVDEYRFVYRMTSAVPTAFPITVDDVFLFGNTDLGTIVMNLAHTLTGTVVDADGAPLTGIDTNIYDASGASVDLNDDDTDAIGNFSVLVPEGTWDVVHRQVTASPTEERVPHAFHELNVAKNLGLGIIVLPVGFHITGQVVGSAGEAIEDANLDAEDAATGNSIHLNNDGTTATGTFDILLPDGSMNIEVDPPVIGPVRQPQLVQVEVTAPGPIDLGTITLPDAVLLSGRCVDSAGIPIPLINVELLVSATGADYPTLHENGGPDGTFSVAVEPDTYDLLLLPEPTSGLAPVMLSQIQLLGHIQLGDLILNPEVTLSGTVTIIQSPLVNATVQIQNPATDDIPPWGTTTTDSLGNYSLEFAPGFWNLIFTPPPGSGTPSHTEANLDVSQDLVFNLDLLTQPDPVSNVTCSLSGNLVQLEWTNTESDYDNLLIAREGQLLTTLPGNQTEYTDPDPIDGQVTNYQITAIRSGIESETLSCTVEGPVVFIRCDPGNDQNVSIADAVNILEHLFGSTAIPCLDSADCNDSGVIDIADAVYVLQFLFVNGTTPPQPYPDAGIDPTPDNLGCF